ncbi:Uncharacterized protein HZ326_23124 [Fusarium oxysporum f. sp. albedinis]|nr:Uncharacterized protein HZ326_23124 [Fusarium oxysporum f. sp. albedinis]
MLYHQEAPQNAFEGTTVTVTQTVLNILDRVVSGVYRIVIPGNGRRGAIVEPPRVCHQARGRGGGHTVYYRHVMGEHGGEREGTTTRFTTLLG